MRAALFFVALAVLAKAMFPEVNAWLGEREALRALPAWAREALLHVPYALVVWAVGAHARLWARLPANPAWYVLPITFALGQWALPWLAATEFGAAAPWVKVALLLACVPVLLRVTPKAGSLYEARTLPGVFTFVALTLLLALSMPLAAELAGLPAVGKVAAAAPRSANLIVAAAVVVAFIIASRLRERPVQANPANKWLAVGIAAFLLSEALRITAAGGLAAPWAAHTPLGPYLALHGATLALPLRVAAHAILFVGTLYLLTHLLPRRGADELA